MTSCPTPQRGHGSTNGSSTTTSNPPDGTPAGPGCALRREQREAQINTTVTRGNVHELPQILLSVITLGALLWSVFFLMPTGRGKNLEALDADEAEEVLHWLHDVSALVAFKTTEAPHFRRVAMQRAGVPEFDDVFRVGPLRSQLRVATAEFFEGRAPVRRHPLAPLGVNSGRGFAFIDHVGVVYASGFLPVAAGSVRDTLFLRICREWELLQALRNSDGFGGRCGRCEFRNICGGSRSHANAVIGDPFAEDPRCLHRPAGAA